MIRINLLRGGAGAKGLLAGAGGWSFLSKREALLGGVFLLAGCLILLSQISWQGGSDAGPEPDLATIAAAQPAEPAAAPSLAGDGAEEPAEASAAGTAEEPAPAAEVPAPPPPPPPAPAPVERSAVTAGPLAAAAAAAQFAVTGLQLVPWGDALEVFVAVEGEPETGSFQMDSPDRWVFNLPSTFLEIAPEDREMTVSHPLVERLRIAQFSLDPPIVRLVLETPGAPSAETSAAAAGVSIKLYPAAP